MGGILVIFLGALLFLAVVIFSVVAILVATVHGAGVIASHHDPNAKP